MTPKPKSPEKEPLDLRPQVSPEFYFESPLTFVSQQKLGMTLARIKLLEKALELHGAIIECGVYKGSTFMVYYHLCSMLEPYCLNRKLIGFDTFEGIPSTSDKDNPEVKKGMLDAGSYDLLQYLIQKNDKFRVGGHIPFAELVKGDAVETIPKYVKEHPGLVIALLLLDFDLYEPLVTALEYLLPLVVKGGIVAIDDLGSVKYPGADRAFLACVSPDSVHLRRFPFDPWLSWWVKGD